MNLILIIFFLHNLDYKDSAVYRKPEWVTRMEVIRAQMLGTNSMHPQPLPRIRLNYYGGSDSEGSMSIDSATMHELISKCHSMGDVSTGSDSVFVSEGAGSRRASFPRACDEQSIANQINLPVPHTTHYRQQTTGDLGGVASASIFAQSVLTGYLQSHRQSISAAIEAICPTGLDDYCFDQTPTQSDYESSDAETLPEHDTKVQCDSPIKSNESDVTDEEDEDNNYMTSADSSAVVQSRLEVPRHLNFVSTMLSPIQENGETPTSDSVTIEQSVSKMQQSAKNSTPDLLSASSMEELKEFLMLETLYTS